MIRALAFVPEAPLLVATLTVGTTPELDALRAACRRAITAAAAPGRRLVVLGSGDANHVYLPTARGSLAGFGVDLEVPLGSDEPGTLELPLSLTVGAWLVREALGLDTGASGCAVADALPVLDDGPDTTLVVVGDGSARRTEKAPGYLDPRAAGYDAWIAEALRDGAGARLRGPVDASANPHALLAAGRRVWAAVAALTETQSWDAQLLYDDAPFGVGYFVAVWTRHE